MTGVFFAIAFVWLSTLTIAFIGVTRHLGAVQASGTAPATGQNGAILDTDGPWIPSSVPQRVRSALSDHDVQVDDLILTFFAASCGTCLEKALEIRSVVSEPQNNVFLVAGSDEELVNSMVNVLAPTGVRVILDPAAQNIVKGLDVKSTPFTLRVIDGQVVAKSFVRGSKDYTRMTDSALRARTELPVVPSAVGAESM